MFQVTVVRVIQQGPYTLIMLFDEQQQRVLPLWLRRVESQTLVEWSQGTFPPQYAPVHNPSPIDFLIRILNVTGDSVEEVRIDVLEEDILYAVVRLRRETTQHEVEARVGEALSLSVRAGSHIFVAKEVLDRLGMKLPAEEGSTQEQRLAILEEKLRHYLPPSVLIADVAGISNHFHNLDFREGIRGWWKSQSIEFGRDTTIKRNSDASVSLRWKVGNTKGSLGQAFLADDYRGKQIWLEGWVKTQDMISAGLYIQLDGLNGVLYKTDRMIEGTRDWTLCMLEVNVPENTTLIHIGLLMMGTGQVWLDMLQLEEVAATNISESPLNLNLEQALHYWVPSNQMDVERENLPQGYECGVDHLVKHHSKASAYLKADIPEFRGYLKIHPELAGVGVLKQVIFAGDYRGRRLRLTGSVKTEGIKHRTGLFLGTFGPEEMLSLDEMQDRPLQGTQDWNRYEVIVTIPKESEFITFGMFLYGRGQVWLEDVHLEGEEIDSI